MNSSRLQNVFLAFALALFFVSATGKIGVLLQGGRSLHKADPIVPQLTTQQVLGLAVAVEAVVVFSIVLKMKALETILAVSVIFLAYRISLSSLGVDCDCLGLINRLIPVSQSVLSASLYASLGLLIVGSLYFMNRTKKLGVPPLGG